MADQSALVSKAFQTFLTEAPNHAQAWGKMVQELGASRDEVVSAILVGLPAALDAYDSL
jgi:hypothetical protein